MLTPAQALQRILGLLTPLAQVEAVALERSVARVLARAPRSDVDLPPFDKSAMDGFAVRSADFGPEGLRELALLGESRAGAPLRAEVGPGECAAIYTGAELPRGADAVVIVEQSRALPDGRVRLEDRPKPGQHLCRRASDLAVGMPVLAAGRRVRAVDLALLAAVGCEPVPVVRRPRVAVLTSGDELVAPDALPGRGQIREGNTLHLAAMASAAGAEVVLRGVVRDDEGELRRAFEDALERCDALLTTGGVSMGKYDLVGAALERCGVRGEFHKVAIKPGKPLWFGVRGSVPVFALPGNPVSCLVNHEVFVAPALRVLGGEARAEVLARPARGRWRGTARGPNPREQYLPVRLEPADDGGMDLVPVPWNGSADVVGISRCAALAVQLADAPLAPGDVLAYRPLA
ncbi:MAG: molybdopterin molybdotransferase MoeA [Planctomycetes bacterium]|nr:molybdopterin molybdotransferase MoeA [Planctomycetota bacterium]